MKRLILPLVGLIAAGTALAYSGRPAIEGAIREAAQAIKRLGEQNHESPCLGDIEIAASYLSSAATKVHYQRFALALTDLSYACSELKAIATTRDWCRDVSLETVPVMVDACELKAQLDLLSRVQE